MALLVRMYRGPVCGSQGVPGSDFDFCYFVETPGHITFPHQISHIVSVIPSCSDHNVTAAMTILSTPSSHALLRHLICPRLSFLSLGSTRIAYPPQRLHQPVFASYQPVCALRCGIPRLLEPILSTGCGVSEQRTARHSRPLSLPLLPGDTVVDHRACWLGSCAAAGFEHAQFPFR
ncbi:hypothetical protein EI94DRAFT_925915 [Lactarius quietus]|nr:hypothetical protein EI94DRAFT_925915 [Lactarius quietus]